MVQVGYTICYIGFVKIIRANCLCRVHSGSIKIMGAVVYVGHKLCYFGSIKIMGAYCVGRAHNMLHVPDVL